MKMPRNLILIVLSLTMSMACCAQENGLLHGLHFEHGTCERTIIATPTDLMRATMIDTACVHRKQPMSELAFVYNGLEYVFYIDYDLEERAIDSILTWVDSSTTIQLSITFFQFCEELSHIHYTNKEQYCDGAICPLGIITHFNPHPSKGIQKEKGLVIQPQ